MNEVDFRELARIATAGGPLAARVVEHLRNEIHRLQSELERSRDEARRLRNEVLEALRVPNPFASVANRDAETRREVGASTAELVFGFPPGIWDPERASSPRSR